MSIDASNTTIAVDNVSKWQAGVNPVKVDTAINQIAKNTVWVVTGVKTSDYTASNMEIVRIDPS